MRRFASCFFSLALLTLPGLAFAQTESSTAPVTKEAPVTAGPSDPSAASSNAVADAPGASSAEASGAAAAPSGTFAASGAPTDYAAPEGTPTTKEPPEDRFAYISFSPLHLFAPVVELTGEFRVHRRIGVAVIGGYGSVRPLKNDPRVDVWVVGGQLVTYPVGHFDHGMQLGLEVEYVGASAAVKYGASNLTGTAIGISNGAFVGYKLATPIGFTFNLQAGAAYFTVVDVHSTDGSSAKAEENRVIPIVNVNLGWSF